MNPNNNTVVEQDERSMTPTQRKKLVDLIYRNVYEREDRQQSLSYIDGLTYSDAEEYLASFQE